MWPFSEGSPSTAAGPGQEGHVAGLVGGVGNLAFRRRGLGLNQLRSGHQAGAREAGAADRNAKRTEEISSIYGARLVHQILPGIIKKRVVAPNDTSVHHTMLAPRHHAESAKRDYLRGGD